MVVVRLLVPLAVVVVLRRGVLLVLGRRGGVGSGGLRRVPPRKIGRAGAIHREGCLRPEAEFARNAHFHANSASSAMASFGVDVPDVPWSSDCWRR